jgi:methionyl-tRNA formyltransferase
MEVTLMPTAIVCAYSPVGREALAGLLEAGMDVLGLYTYPHGQEDGWFVPPAALASEHGIPVHMAPNFNDDTVYNAIQALRPDFLFSFYFREMIQARFLDLPRLGAYNLHGSLLPHYRGRAPINWVLLKGEQRTGITLHTMTPKPDDGDIVGQAPLDIAWDETALSLTLRCAQAGRTLVRSVVPELVAGRATRVPQKSLGPSTYFGGRKPEDGELDLAGTTADAFNLIRAVADPWPNAFIKTVKGTLKVPWALPTAAPCPPGHFQETRDGVLLGLADGALRLHALRKGADRSERPTEQAQWLRELGLPEWHQGA